MASDRARLSDDPGRSYRGVVLQQGRVTLEADGNEARRLAETALRQDVIDIVGPAGTPDDGYAVSAASGGFEIGTGTYYLGGWRVTLDQPMPLGGGPDALDLPAPALSDGSYAVALLLTEQEVSVVEDRALREVALGGPDTAQRTRLMQRAVAVPTDAEDCAGAAAAVGKALAAEGAAVDPATGMLLPTARLLVTLIAPPASADPCDPPASGGYLGADNQLIRVSVTAFDSATGKGRLVWAYDNASTLYRVSTTDGKVLTLEGEPIDTDHSPRLGQAVEVLQTRALFDHGDTVAADAGVVTEVAQPYDPDLRRVEIAKTLDPAGRGDAQHPLFLRLWEAEIDFAEGTAVELGTTGLAVTLTLDALGSAILARPFWCFAARPSTPVIVYPQRYLDTAQPPEGPRQWLAPLALVAVAGKTGEVIDDCRDTFLPLTRIRPGCCGVTLDASMTGHRDFIQAALNRLRGTRGTVTLRPGHYRLRKPLRLDASHRGLTLEGCGEGVFLEALNEDDPAFAQGLIVLDDVNEVALRWLQFQMPAVVLGKEEFSALAAVAAGTGVGSVAVVATGCAQLTIADCQFRFRLREQRPMFAVGLLGRGECWGLKLLRNRFLHDIDYQQPEGRLRALFGYVLAPAIALDERRPGVKEFAAARLDALLDDAVIEGNEFVGLSLAMLVSARLGHIRVERNRVLGCSGGIYLLESAMAAALRTAGTGLRNTLPIDALTATMRFAATTPGAGTAGRRFVAADMQRSARAAEARSQALAQALRDSGESDTGDDDAQPAHAFLDSLVRMASAIDTGFESLAPCLHVSGNDIEVFGALLHQAPDEGSEAELASLGALQIVFEQRDEPLGDLIVTANRVSSLRNPAMTIAFSRRLVVASNIVSGSGGDEADGALRIIVDPGRSVLEVMANVVYRYARIIPGERPMDPSRAWNFVNRVF